MPTKCQFTITLLALISLALGVPRARAVDPLVDGFTNPPATAKPWVYWYFMDGNSRRTA